MRDQQVRRLPRNRIEAGRPIWWTIGIAAVVVLAGCTSRDRDLFGWSRYTAGRQSAPARASPTTKPAPRPSPGAPGPPVSEASIEADGVPDRLIGLDEQRLTSLFGPPNQKIDRAPGKAWVYRRGRCALDLSLYPDIETRVFRTLAYEVTSDDNTDKGKRLCLAELRSAAGSR